MTFSLNFEFTITHYSYGKILVPLPKIRRAQKKLETHHHDHHGRCHLFALSLFVDDIMKLHHITLLLCYPYYIYLIWHHRFILPFYGGSISSLFLTKSMPLQIWMCIHHHQVIKNAHVSSLDDYTYHQITCQL